MLKRTISYHEIKNSTNSYDYNRESMYLRIHKNTIFLQNMNIGPHKFKGTYKNQFHKVYVIYNWSSIDFSVYFDVGLHTVHDNVDRIDSRFVSVEEFQQKYEKTYTPVVIVNDQLDWPATKKWYCM
jgi:hypothetical protein